MQYSIFSMQVVRRLHQPQDPFHQKLHTLITSEPGRASYSQKHSFYRALSNRLLQGADSFEQGVWDYWDDPSRAQGDFQDWVDGLKGREARTRPAPEDGQPRYLVCTIALLLQHGSSSDQRLLRHCNIPEDRLWTRATFIHLLKGMELLNFLHVKSDVVYLLPGDEPAYGLTAEDLASQDYDYLRKLT